MKAKSYSKSYFILWSIGLLLCLLNCACNNSPKTNPNRSSPKASLPIAESTFNFRNYIGSIGSIETFDKKRFLEKEIAWFIDSTHIVCRLSPLLHANRASITPWGQKKHFEVEGFTAVDRTNGFVVLKIKTYKATPIPLARDIAREKDKSIYLSQPQSNTLPLHQGMVLSYSTIHGSKRYAITNPISSSRYGTPLFLPNGQCIGLGYNEIVDYDPQSVVIPSTVILALLHSGTVRLKPLSQIRSGTSAAISAANAKIKGLVIHTDRGNITIRLYNSTPQYRDNFIALVKEHFYDSLLIHRVIPGFCIQTGAADSRYAAPGDVVGWKGPGYTLPAHIVPGLFHRRGTIGSPRLPDDRNHKKRSNASQFYLITGRTYSADELDEIEKKNGHHFTTRQRQIYQTIGGAPHLDGKYTIFGEVISGMDIADRINQVATDKNDRPLKNIRIQKITILH